MATASSHTTKRAMVSSRQPRPSQRRPCAIGSEIAWRPGEATDFTQTEPPVIRIPQLINFLRDMDVDRCPDWKHWIEDVKEYVEYVDQLRHRIRDQSPDDSGFRPDEDLFPEALDPMFEDAKLFLGLHKTFEDWNYNETPWANIRRPDSFLTERLPIHNRLKEGSTHLVPRPLIAQHPPFRLLPIPPTGIPDYKNYFQSADGQLNREVLDSLRLEENAFWAAQPGGLADDGPEEANWFAVENETYEQCAQGGFPEIVANPPTGADPTDMRLQAVHRGWRRAAIQQCLSLFTNTENKELITPWMRVVLPEPPRKMKELVFEPLALRQDGPDFYEPFPWIHWYNKYREHTMYHSAWARRVLHKKHWNDYKKVALPMNYCGPYIFDDKCVFDDHWLKLSKSIFQLSLRLRNTVLMRGARGNGRKFLQQIADDVASGMSRRDIPVGIVPRSEGDWEEGSTDEFQLVDEKDMEWLRFLCEPATNRDSFSNIVSKRLEPDNALFTLFDHRVQTWFNDRLVAAPDEQFVNRFWKFVDNSDEEGEGFPQVMSLSVTLQELLVIANSGGRDQVKIGETGSWRETDPSEDSSQPPNELYQFTLEQAQKYCIELATAGRLCYECPKDVLQPKQRIATSYHGNNHLFATRRRSPSDYGRVGLRVYEIYPELRVRWRYEHFSQRDSTDSRLLASLNAAGAGKEREDFVPETLCRTGCWYEEDSAGDRRGAPSWADLASPKEVLDKKYKKPSSRTVNFFRVLAWRMGRTIRFCSDLEAHTKRKSGLTRKHLGAALWEWDEAVASSGVPQEQPESSSSSDMSAPPGTLEAVVQRADQRYSADHPLRHLDPSEAFEQIRLGLIEDAVQNRTMIYPCRMETYKDAQGNAYEALERHNIWAWAHPDIRKFHRIRVKHFDMKRWPLNRQSAETARKMRSREDERQPEQMYWMLPALERYGRRPKVKTRSAAGMFDPHLKELDAEQDHENATKVVEEFSNRDEQLTQSANQSRNEMFIQGPPVFPMGDTVLKQVAMSHELENLLHRPRPPSLLSRATSFLTPNLLPPPPTEVPLLAPLPDPSRVPSSHPTKRKAASFITEVPPPKRRVVLERDGSARIINVASGQEADRAAAAERDASKLRDRGMSRNVGCQGRRRGEGGVRANVTYLPTTVPERADVV